MSDVKPPRRPLWQRVLFGTSLAVNVLIIGAVAGLILSGGRDEGKRPPPLRNGGVAALIGMLPPDHREAMLVELRQIGRERGVSHRTLIEDRNSLVAVITAVPFDPQAFLVALEASQDRFAHYRQDSHVLLADKLAEMDAEEREAYGERLMKFRRWRDRPGKMDGRKPREDSDGY